MLKLQYLTKVAPNVNLGPGFVACGQRRLRPGPEVIKLFAYSTQTSTQFILLINVKIPTIVGILIFISMINTISERLKA